MNKKPLLLLAITVIVLAASVVLVSADRSEADTEPEPKVLLDMGNGQTTWVAPGSGTLDDVLTTAFSQENMTFSSSGGTITVNGLTSRAFSDSTAEWHYYVYSSGWVDTAYNGSSTYDGSYIAVGFYPAGIVPTVTPSYKTAWTCIHGDSLNSGTVNNYDADILTGSLNFSITDDTVPASYATPLTANGHFIAMLQHYKGPAQTHMASYNIETGAVEWDTFYVYNSYDLATGAIYGGNAYFPTCSGKVNCIPIVGPNAGTITHDFVGDVTYTEKGSTIMRGMSSIVYDSGHLFIGSTSGTIYCTTPNLDIVWQTKVGTVYPSTSVSVANGLVYVGGCDGKLYILDEVTGAKKTELLLYYDNGGRVGTPAVLGENIIVSFNDGKGMSCAYWNAAVLKYNASTNIITKVTGSNLDLSVQNNFLVISPSKTFVYASADNVLYRIYTNGGFEKVGDVSETHGGFTLVNNTYLYATDYDEKGSLVVYNMSLKKLAEFSKKTANQEAYTMAGTFVAGNYIGVATDSGAFVIKGVLVDGKDDPDPTPPTPPTPPEPEPEVAATVKFLIVDTEKFYFCIEGSGVTVIDALTNAITDNGYSDYVKYSGGESRNGIQSLFGMSYIQTEDDQFMYWMSYQWDSGTDYWVTAENTMNNLQAKNNSAFMIYYGKTTGMTTPAPENLPKSSELVPLKASDEGTRFLIESSTTEFFIVNGVGDNALAALENACITYAIPHDFSGADMSLFGITATAGNSWKGFQGDSGKWVASAEPLSGSSGKVYSVMYGSAAAVPTVSVDSVIKLVNSDGGNDWVSYVILVIALILLVIFMVFLIRGAKAAHMSVPAYFKNLISPSSAKSKVKQNKLRLLIVCLLGLSITFVMFIVCLAVGPSVTLSLTDTLSALVSAVGKHGQNLDFKEIIVYETRLPRAMAALSVGIGLSIAGCVYQAIIRNPLVDPYIMGVSSGAGTFAVAAIVANFTFFGLLVNNSFSTPILAAVGGLLAFALTMIIAEKAGGSSTNYVLAGVVIGLVFSALQTLMLVTSNSDKLTSAISWLFGSFANVGWNTVWIITFPSIFLAIVPLFWAKELNLVLLGEDQAKQMGLDVRKFNRWMLILASVLTSVCVAFVGIIGFVGMVIPHLSRMLLGGDHRLVLPSSIMMGGALMLFADLLAKMLMVPTELPVGAITTIIGVPVFAYLLIKKGRMYNG